MERTIRLERIREGSLVLLVNHYTTRGIQVWLILDDILFCFALLDFV